jgi:hypothetical protein
MRAVEVLYFEGCPNVEVAADHARRAVAGAGDPAVVRLVCIDGDADAMRQRFLGSPTIRVDGVDVDASARERTDFGLQCRVYWADGKLSAAPPIAWIEAALQGDARESMKRLNSSATCAPSAARQTSGK